MNGDQALKIFLLLIIDIIVMFINIFYGLILALIILILANGYKVRNAIRDENMKEEMYRKMKEEKNSQNNNTSDYEKTETSNKFY